MNKNIESIYYLTALQHGMIHHSRTANQAGVYVEQFTCKVHGLLDTTLFDRAWQVLVKRHSVFRTSFMRLDQTKPVQVVHRQATMPVYHKDWSHLIESEKSHQFDELMREDRQKGFDFSNAPLSRLYIVSESENCHRLLWTYHHCILDGWSMPIVLNELLQIYHSLVKEGRVITNMVPATPYQKFVKWLANSDQEIAKKYWLDNLSTFNQKNNIIRSSIDLNPTVNIQSSSQLLSYEFSMPVSWVKSAQIYCKLNKYTLNIICQLAWGLTVSYFSHREDVVYGTVLSGRPRDLKGVDEMVGLFIATVPIRLKTGEEVLITDLLACIQQQILGAEEHSYYPLIDIQQCSEIENKGTLFDSIFVFENYPGRDSIEKLAQHYELILLDMQAIEETNYPLALIAVPNDKLDFKLVYDKNQVSTKMIKVMLDIYKAVLTHLITVDDETPVRNLLKQAKHTSSFSKNIKPSNKVVKNDIVGFTEAQSFSQNITLYAEKFPNRIALRTETEVYSYEKLHLLGLQLVDYFTFNGVEEGDTIAFTLDNVVLVELTLYALSHIGADMVYVQPNSSQREIRELTGLLTIKFWAVNGCNKFDSKDYGSVLNVSLDILEKHSVKNVNKFPPRNSGGLWYVNWHSNNPLEIGYFSEVQYCNYLTLQRNVIDREKPSVVPFWSNFSSNVSFETLYQSSICGMELVIFEEERCLDYLKRVFDPSNNWDYLVFDHFQTRQLAFYCSSHQHDQLNFMNCELDMLACNEATLQVISDSFTSAKADMRERVRLLYRPHSICLAINSSYCSLTLNGNQALSIDSISTPSSNVCIVDRSLSLSTEFALGNIQISGLSLPIKVLSKERKNHWLFKYNGSNVVSSYLSENRGWHEEGIIWLLDIREQAHALNDIIYKQLISKVQFELTSEECILTDYLSTDNSWGTVLWIDERKWSIEFSESCRMQVSKYLGGQPIITRLINGEELKLNDRSSLQDKINYILDKALHVEPSTETEKLIYAIWKNLLEEDQFGVHDNYFQLGGQSLMTTVMLSEIQQVFTIELSIEELLSNLTISNLAELVECKLDGGNTNNLQNRIGITVDLQEEVNLYKDLPPVTPFKLNTLKMDSIFLTGASGFLGAQLLSDLLMSTDADIYCLVRADNVDLGFDKIKSSLNKYQLWEASFKDRILIICGALDKPLLGLTQSEFNNLGKNIDVIYHNGASVNFVYTYNQLKGTNVLGTREIIRLASEHKTKPIHYISTVGVLDRTLPNIEETLNIKLHSNMGSGYEQSKWVSEQLLNIASVRGVPIAIYRPSRVVGNSITGIANSGDLFCRMIKGMIEFGKAPVEAGYDNMVPVDYASRMIIEASLNIESLGKAFHVVNPNWHRIDEVVNFTVDKGYQLDLLPYDQWLGALTEHVKTNMSNPLTLLMPVLRRLNPIDDPTISMIIPIESIQLRNVIGDELVEDVPTTEDICSVHFNFFYESGFLTKAIESPESLSVDCA